MNDDLAVLAESADLECKAAQGIDGQGELPTDFWKSYSAMANMQGGIILLGVQEKPRGVFRVAGLKNIERVRKALWDNLHNPKQISINLLAEQHIQPVEINGKIVLRVEIPRASRQQRPVHLGSNPFGGTFLRRYEGDYQADDETVRRMLAERVEDSRDERILKGFDFADLDMDSVTAYRHRFSASDCRNRRLQTLFQLVGYGDHAGSGIPKIYRNWTGQHWRRPLLYEFPEPEQTLMELRMTSLVPAQTLAELEEHLGARFTALPELERMALVTAIAEGMVSHARLREISADHPADITKMLARLVKDGLLESDGIGRGMVYFVPWMTRPSPAGFAGDQPEASTQDNLSPKPGSLTPELSALTPELSALTPELDFPLVAEATQFTESQLNTLRELAHSVRERERVSPEMMRSVVLSLCSGCYIGLRLLSELLNRDSDDLRKRILNPLVKEGLLRRAFRRPNDPRQAYTSSLIQAATHADPKK